MPQPPAPGKPQLPHQPSRNPGAPGTPKGPPLSGRQPSLTPQPKPKGPAKGGPPPMGTKPQKSLQSMITRGERTSTGHADSHHKRVGQTPAKNAPPAKQNIAVRAQTENKVVTAPASPKDKTRMLRQVSKSPEFKAAQKQLSKAPVGTRSTVNVPTPGNRGPMLQKATPTPGGTPVISTVRAQQVTVPLVRTNRGVVPVTAYGSDKTAKKP